MADAMAGLSIQFEGYGSTNQRLTLVQSTSPAPLTSSASANYARLGMLVIDAGTEATARKVNENLPDSQTVDDALGMEHGHMQWLVSKRIITQPQFEILYPPSSLPVNEDEIDLTLWVILLRNITSKAKKNKWVVDPQPWQRQYWHDIQRLKIIRNKLAHNRKAELSDESFKQLWQETEEVLLRLGVSKKDIDICLERDLEPERAKQAVQ